MSSSTPPPEEGITLVQVVDALRALGVNVPGPGDDLYPRSRAEGLGLLLFMAESALIIEHGPIGHEMLKIGYVRGIYTAIKGVPPQDAEYAAQEATTRLLDTRLDRTMSEAQGALQAMYDLQVGQAVGALLSAVITLVRTGYPLAVHEAGTEVPRMAAALKEARGHMGVARQALEADQRKLRQYRDGG